MIDRRYIIIPVLIALLLIISSLITTITTNVTHTQVNQYQAIFCGGRKSFYNSDENKSTELILKWNQKDGVGWSLKMYNLL